VHHQCTVATTVTIADFASLVEENIIAMNQSIPDDHTLLGAIDKYGKALLDGRSHLTSRYLTLLEDMAYQWLAAGGENRLAAFDVLWLTEYWTVTPASTLLTIALTDFYRWAGRRRLVDATPDLAPLLEGHELPTSLSTSHPSSPNRLPEPLRTPFPGPDGNAGQILLVEYGSPVAAPFGATLAAAGYTITYQRGGVDAWRAVLAQAPILVLIEAATDPGASLALCAALRQRSQVPLILWNAYPAYASIIQAFECGADAVIRRACAALESAARIQAVLRRAAMPPPSPLRMSEAGGVLDASASTVTINKRKVKLTPTEYQLLRCLLHHRNQPVARDQLCEGIWGRSSATQHGALASAIRRLRCKIEPDPSVPQYLRTVPGAGYQFVPPNRLQEGF